MRQPPTADEIPFPFDGDRYLALRNLSAYSGLSIRLIRGFLKHPIRPIPYRRVGAKFLVGQSDYDLRMDSHHPGPGVDAVLAEIRRARDGVTDSPGSIGKLF